MRSESNEGITHISTKTLFKRNIPTKILIKKVVRPMINNVARWKKLKCMY